MAGTSYQGMKVASFLCAMRNSYITLTTKPLRAYAALVPRLSYAVLRTPEGNKSEIAIFLTEMELHGGKVICKVTQMVRDGVGLEPRSQVPSTNTLPAPSPMTFYDGAIQMQG